MQIEFHFISAPISLSKETVESMWGEGKYLGENSHFSWWRNINEDLPHYEGFENSLKYVESVFETKGPFQGILGFFFFFFLIYFLKVFHKELHFLQFCVQSMKMIKTVQSNLM